MYVYIYIYIYIYTYIQSLQHALNNRLMQTSTTRDESERNLRAQGKQQ